MKFSDYQLPAANDEGALFYYFYLFIEKCYLDKIKIRMNMLLYIVPLDKFITCIIILQSIAS